MKKIILLSCILAIAIAFVSSWGQEPTVIKEKFRLPCDDCTWDVSSPLNVTCVKKLLGFTAQVTCPEGQVRSGAIRWSAPGGYPSIGQGNSFTTNYYFPGLKLVTAECGECGSQSWSFLVLGMEITEPDQNPIWDNEFLFDAATPGVCNVTVTGTSGITSKDPEIEWTLDEIVGSTQISNPDPPKGPNIIFTYTNMPSSNAQLGEKELALNHPELSADCKAVQVAEIFFSRDARNHGGPGSGVTPNWFYYWKEGGVVSDLTQFDYQDADGWGAYNYSTGLLYVRNWAPTDDYLSVTLINQYWMACINTGSDGLANTPPREDDDKSWEYLGNGKPHTKAITAGPDLILNSVKSGDDSIYANSIWTGPNGIRDSDVSGDDGWLFEKNKGKPFTIWITAGSDLYMHSGDNFLQGDDKLDIPSAFIVEHYVNYLGIDCCAETCSHELMHKFLFDMVGGPPNPNPTSDGDYVDDTYELNSPYHLDPNRIDTYNVANTPGIGYGDDNEFLARMAEHNPGLRDATKDWSNINGKQWHK